jgi:hypothetical protein
MIRIAITSAVDAISATLPLGSVAFERDVGRQWRATGLP